MGCDDEGFDDDKVLMRYLLSLYDEVFMILWVVSFVIVNYMLLEKRPKTHNDFTRRSMTSQTNALTVRCGFEGHVHSLRYCQTSRPIPRRGEGENKKTQVENI